MTFIPAISTLCLMCEKEHEDMNHAVSWELIRELWRYFSICFGVSPPEGVVAASLLAEWCRRPLKNVNIQASEERSLLLRCR